jgi:nucleotide-binding universal stress UspA family protein
MIEKILVAVAGRGLCEEMVNMLMDIPACKGASITLLHVVSPQTIADDMSAKLEEGGKVLAEAVKSIKVDASKVNARLKQGDPKTIVCDVAEEENADLIIMGSRALGRLRAILEGSVSQYVFQLASRPMLLIKDDTYVKRIKRVMVAMNNSPEAQQSLELALAFTRGVEGSQLVLVHVNPPKLVDKPEDDEVLAAAVTEAKKFGINYRCIVSNGKAGPEICRIAEDINADLLLLGSPDRRPNIAKNLVDLDRLLGNSLSDYVRVNADCPVLLVRR